MTLPRPARWMIILCAAAPALSVHGCSEPDTRYDLVIAGGQLFDGSGAAPRQADVAVRGDRVVAVGTVDPTHGNAVIDAQGLAVAPGLINAHSWATGSLLIDGRSMSDLMQGVTTVVFGEGITMGPLNDRLRTYLATERDPDFPPPGYDIDWTTLRGYLDHVASRGVTPNVASFVGATTLRRYSVGDDDRRATADELDAMVGLADHEMALGALGVGSRLAYPPASFASTEELTALARSAARHGGRYISHIRSEGNELLEAVDEFLRIVEGSGAGGTIYHLKAAGAPNWPKMDSVIARLEQARAAGLDVDASMYPYRAGSTGLDASIPPWVHEGGPEALRERLADPALRPRIAREIATVPEGWENYFYLAGGAENVTLVEFQKEGLKPLQGQTLAQVAEARGTDPATTIIDLVLEDESLVQVVYVLNSEENVRKQLALPWVFFGSDAPSVAAQPPFVEASVHPRAYGTFARVLGRYARDEGLIPVEEAIRRMTRLPAEQLGLEGRGRIEEGAFADLIVFDAERVRDLATYDQPHRYAEGMRHVVVNGEVVLRDGQHTGAMPGRALRLRSGDARAGGPPQS